MQCISIEFNHQLRFTSAMTIKAQRSMIPVVGTVIHFQPEDVTLSADGVNYVCRITYDEDAEKWIIASRWNAHFKKWVSLTKSRRIGMFVFLNSKPEAGDNVIRVTAIQPTGRGAYGDPDCAPVDADGGSDEHPV
jgi:hypothetical protein